MQGSNAWERWKRQGGLNSRVQLPSTATVFISHRSTDKLLARMLAAEIRLWGIDVWLDEDDEATQAAAASKDDEALALAIEAGVKGSTHMLALWTANTSGSMWVPYEVGAGRAWGRPLGLIVQRGSPPTPSWAALGHKLLTRFGLGMWLQSITAHQEHRFRLWPNGTAKLSDDLEAFLY
jgi:hypothetical protein